MTPGFQTSLDFFIEDDPCTEIESLASPPKLSGAALQLRFGQNDKPNAPQTGNVSPSQAGLNTDGALTALAAVG